MITFITNLDLIGPTPALYINKSNRFKTFFGGILTFVLTFLCIFAIGLFGSDIFLRRNPINLASKQYIDSPQLKRSSLFFLIAPLLKGGKVIKDIQRKLNLRMQVADTNSNRNITTIFTDFQLVQCAETNDFKRNFSTEQLQLLAPLQSYFCLPDTFNYGLEGQFGQSKFILYQFIISICKNSTTNGTCLPEEEIRNELNLTYTHFIYMDYFNDVANFNSPLKEVYNSDLLEGNSNVSRTDIYVIKMLDVITDRGWLFERKDIISRFQYDQKTNLIFARSDFLYKIQITLSNLKETNVRKYIKIYDIFANVGGFIKFASLSIVLINNLFVKNIMMEHIFLSFYKKYKIYSNMPCDGNTDPMKPDHLFIKQNKYNSLKNIHNTSAAIFNQSIANENMLQSNLMKILKVPNKKKEIYENLTFKEKMCWCLVRGSQKYLSKKRVLDIVGDIMKSTLEVEKIMKTVEKMKMTDKFIFGEEGQNIKSALFYIQFLEKINRSLGEAGPAQTSTRLNGYLMEIFRERKLLDINKIVLDIPRNQSQE